MNTFPWTPDLIERALDLYYQGHAMRDIAAAIGCSRNAVIGKIHREQLKRGLAIRPADSKPSTPKPAPPKPEKRKVMTPALPVPVVLKPDESNLASIVDVTGCKWPVKDDPEFVGGMAFCNHDPAHGSSYCEYHRTEGVAPYSAKLIRKTLGALGLRFAKRRAA